MRTPTVVVVTPSRGTVHSRTVEAVHRAVLVAERAGAAKPVGSEWWVFAHGLPIPWAHEEAARRSVASGADLIWFIEDDNLPPADGLVRSVDRMGETGASYVAIDYPIGQPPPLGDGTRWATVYRLDGEVQFTGLGITLIAREVFERLSRPWFPNTCCGALLSMPTCTLLTWRIRSRKSRSTTASTNC